MEPLKEAEMKQSTRQVGNEMDEQVLETRGTVFQGGCVGKLVTDWGKGCR